MAIDMKPPGDFKVDDIILINLIDIYSQKLFVEIKRAVKKSNIYTNQIKSMIEAESTET